MPTSAWSAAPPPATPTAPPAPAPTPSSSAAGPRATGSTSNSRTTSRATGSVRVGADHLALVPRGDLPDRDLVGGRLEEPDRAVGHRDVRPAGVVAAQAVAAVRPVVVTAVEVDGAVDVVAVRRDEDAA